MWQPDPEQLARRLSGYFGFHLEGAGGQSAAGDPWLEIRPAGIHPNDSFHIRMELGWRSLRAMFIPGSFAGHLIAEMGRAGVTNQATFARLAEKCLDENGTITMIINGAGVSSVSPGTWPAAWQSLHLSLDKTPLAINTEDHEENDRQLELWARRVTGLVLSLLPLEEVEQPVNLNPEGLPEGASIRLEVNRYERSNVNRANCISIHGDSCKACGFNFGKAYGPIGEGFIHVHHITPVSQLGPDYRIDPAKDLIPLCPNCHAMAHRTNPPLSLAKLRELLPKGTPCCD